jgi:hypothetical protein
MKRFILLLASISVLALPVLPAQASLVADTDATDTMNCLKLLFTDSDAHAAECGGPFEIEKSNDPLVKGTYAPGCEVTEVTPLTLIGGDLRVLVAGPAPCGCAFLAPTQLQPAADAVFRFRVAC